MTRSYGEKPAWQTISLLSVGLLGSITAELILTGSAVSVADELELNKQMLGRSATSLTAFFTLFPRIKGIWKMNQRVSFSILFLLLGLSNIIIYIDSNLIMFVIGMVLLGIVVGGFSLSFITVSRTLVSGNFVTKSFSTIFPLLLLVSSAIVAFGSILCKMFDARTFAFLVIILLIVSFFSLLIELQSFKAKSQKSEPALIDLLPNRANKIATLVVILLLGGQFSFLMYLGPFVEAIADFHGYSSFAFLMTFVIFNFLGGWLDPLILSSSPFLKLIILPAALAFAMLGMVLCDQILWLSYILITFLGFFNGPFMIGWARWLTQSFTSNGSFLLLAVIQFSIALGSVGGGLISKVGGAKGVFTFSGIVLLAVPLCIMVLCSSTDLAKDSR